MRSEAAQQADFSAFRYAQCWEDADVLLEAVQVQPGDHCVSIASAGDNVLAMLSRAPERIVALDLSSAQLAALELRVAAYRVLTHSEVLVLVGSKPGNHRDQLYRRCREHLSDTARRFWDSQPPAIARGIGSCGKFERYFALFRKRILPLVHSHSKVERLLQSKTRDQRIHFYTSEWDTLRWRLLFKVFFSRTVMGRLGRDPSFFRYVEGSVADRILNRTRYALTELDPAENPYVQWILSGTHPTALPYALRPENFEPIRRNLDRLEWRQQSLEEYLDTLDARLVNCYNLSDIFEYMSQENYERLLHRLVRAAKPGCRLVYWNMLADRSRPHSMRDQLRQLKDVASALHARDKAFFYSALVVEEVL